MTGTKGRLPHLLSLPSILSITFVALLRGISLSFMDLIMPIPLVSLLLLLPVGILAVWDGGCSSKKRKKEKGGNTLLGINNVQC